MTSPLARAAMRFVIAVLIASLLPAGPSYAADSACQPGFRWIPGEVIAGEVGDDVQIHARRKQGRCVRIPGSSTVKPVGDSKDQTKTLPESITDRVRVSACVAGAPDDKGNVPIGVDMCSLGSDRCDPPGTPPDQKRWNFRVWERQRHGPPDYTRAGPWVVVGYECYRPDELPPDELEGGPERVLTWVDVYNAVKNEPAAKKRVVVQPAGRTLVNAETIFSTSGADWTKYGLVLLGFRVDVEGRPTSYLWNFGDGESLTTASAGRPYPAKDITHKYMRKAQQLGVTVTTTYKVRYRVDGGAWQGIEQPLTAVGPATPLGVREAVAVLVDPEG